MIYDYNQAHYCISDKVCGYKQSEHGGNANLGWLGIRIQRHCEFDCKRNRKRNIISDIIPDVGWYLNAIHTFHWKPYFDHRTPKHNISIWINWRLNIRVCMAFQKLKFLAVNKREILNKTHETLYCVDCYPYIAFSRNLSNVWLNYITLYNISTRKVSERAPPLDPCRNWLKYSAQNSFGYHSHSTYH